MRRIVEVAAHLGDAVFPPLPVRQWVFSLPKRLRPFLPRDPSLTGAVLRVLVRAIRTLLRKRCPGAPAHAQLGAVSVLHRFGACRHAKRTSAGTAARPPDVDTPPSVDTGWTGP